MLIPLVTNAMILSPEWRELQAEKGAVSMINTEHFNKGAVSMINTVHFNKGAVSMINTVYFMLYYGMCCYVALL